MVGSGVRQSQVIPAVFHARIRQTRIRVHRALQQVDRGPIILALQSFHSRFMQLRGSSFHLRSRRHCPLSRWRQDRARQQLVLITLGCARAHEVSVERVGTPAAPTAPARAPRRRRCCLGRRGESLPQQLAAEDGAPAGTRPRREKVAIMRSRARRSIRSARTRCMGRAAVARPRPRRARGSACRVGNTASSEPVRSRGSWLAAAPSWKGWLSYRWAEAGGPG